MENPGSATGIFSFAMHTAMLSQSAFMASELSLMDYIFMQDVQLTYIFDILYLLLFS